MLDAILAVLSSEWLGAILALPFLGFLNWRNPGMEYLENSSIYDFSNRNEMGLSSSSAWTPGQLMNLEGNTFQWQRPDVSQQQNPAAIQNYLSNEALARQVFGQLPGMQQGGVGASPMSGDSGATSSLQPQSAETLQMGSRLGTVTAPAGGAGAAPAYSITGAPAAGGASAAATPGAGGAGSWFSKIMGNQRMMSGVLTAVGTWYGQYDQKKQAGKMYDAQMRELDARRQYEQARIDAYRNSPAARMAPELMKLALQIYGARLNRHGVQVDPNAWIASIFGAPQGGA